VYQGSHGHGKSLKILEKQIFLENYGKLIKISKSWKNQKIIKNFGELTNRTKFFNVSMFQKDNLTI